VGKGVIFQPVILIATKDLASDGIAAQILRCAQDGISPRILVTSLSTKTIDKTIDPDKNESR